jgi:RNA-directed DNA polymerase
MSADLPAAHDPCDVAWVRAHVGAPGEVLGRWRQLLHAVVPCGWGAVKPYAGDVMDLVAAPKVLFEAATSLRARGPKAPGPNRLPLEALSAGELWGMCTALGQAIRADTYRPGEERVRWVSKASGRGKRPIILMDVQDRVAQKAAGLVLRPMLDGRFDPLSFASRPMRGRFEAVALAEQLALGGSPVWVPHDLVDAYRRVPVPRLLDVFSKLLPCPRLRAFLGRVLPPHSRSVGGIKQGGPLSALALEVYLTHFLHGPWREAGLPARLLRYADDLLLVAADEGTARAADALLRELLTPAGMLLKHAFEEAVCDIRTDPAEWLGFRFRLDGSKFRTDLGVHAFEKLGRRLVLAHGKDRPADRAVAVLRQWVSQLGPCFRRKEAKPICSEAILTAQKYGFEEALPVDDLVEGWEAARLRWKSIRRRVRRDPGYLAEGVVEYPTPTSLVW